MSVTAFDKGYKAASLGLSESGCLMTGNNRHLWLQCYRTYKKQQPVSLEDCFDAQKVSEEFAKRHFKDE